MVIREQHVPSVHVQMVAHVAAHMQHRLSVKSQDVDMVLIVQEEP